MQMPKQRLESERKGENKLEMQTATMYKLHYTGECEIREGYSLSHTGYGFSPELDRNTRPLGVMLCEYLSF